MRTPDYTIGQGVAPSLLVELSTGVRRLHMHSQDLMIKAENSARAKLKIERALLGNQQELGKRESN